MRRSRTIELPPALPKKITPRGDNKIREKKRRKWQGDTIILRNGIEIRGDLMGNEISSKLFVITE